MLVVAIVLHAAPALAEPLPFEASLSLRHPLTVHVGAAGTDTHVAARSGRHVAEVSVPVVLDDATAERLDTSAGPMIVVRATGAGRAYAWLVVERAGAPAIAWSGRTDMHGDPGERVADAIETTDRTGDGRPDVVVGQLREGVTTCGAAPALLFPAAIDPTGALRPVMIARAGPDRVEVTATIATPGPSAPPVGATLRMMGASSALGVTEAAMLAAPYALTDGDPATGWIEGRGGAGAGELAVARVDAPRPIRALALVRSTASGVTAPRSVLILGNVGPALHVTLPDGFERAWIALPEPRSWSCVAVVIESGPSDDAALHVGLGELEAYSELDFGGGIASLIESLVAEGPDAEHTADWLARAGTGAVEAVIASWDRLSALGRRRAVRIAAAHPTNAPSLALLSMAAIDDEGDVRTDALDVLGRAGAPGMGALVALAGSDAGEEAAARLALSRETFDPAPLLAALEGHGADRPNLRAALGARVAHEPAIDDVVSAWAQSASTSAIAALALGVSQSRPALARDLVARATSHASEFADRYRLAVAAQHATPADANDAWLAEVATHAEEWMLRDAALDALALRSPVAIAAGLADDNPRVRATTARILAADPDSTGRLVDRATRDPWPMVRVAALDALAHRAQEVPTLRDRLADRSPMVRERAITLLTERGDRASWPMLATIFTDDDEWPRVTAAALEMASAFCVEDASEAIAAVMHRGTREGAWAPHVDVAVEALRIAIRLGGAAAEEGRAIATRSGNEAFAPILEGQGALPPCASPAASRP
jgi:hypothetical protein